MRTLLLETAVALALTAGLAAVPTPSRAADPAQAQQIAAGKAVFDHSCIVCHGNGPYMGGTQQLRINYGDTKPALLEQRTDLTPALVKFFVRRGYGVMPRFRKTEVTDAQLDAVAAYLSRNNPTLAAKRP